MTTKWNDVFEMVQGMVSERRGRDLNVGDVLVSIHRNKGRVRAYLVSAIVRTETGRFANTKTIGLVSGPTIGSDENVLVLRRASTFRFMRRFVKESFVFEEPLRHSLIRQTEEQAKLRSLLAAGIGSIHLTASSWRRRATSRDIGSTGIFLTEDGFIQTKIEGSVQDMYGIRYSGEGVSRGRHIYRA